MKTTPYRGNEPGPFSCRRRGNRRKVFPTGATCWSDKNAPEKAVVIEADTKGARLILPWPVKQGQDIHVSFANQLGLYRTERARIAWTEDLGQAGRTVAGLYYRPSRKRVA